MSSRKIGLHLRITSTLEDMVRSAIDLKLNLFQFFLINQSNNTYITLTAKEKLFFTRHRARFSDLFIHSSYWINLAAAQPSVFNHSKKLLKREIAAAKTLNIPYLVIHPGSAKGHQTSTNDPDGKIAGIKTTAHMLNSLLKSEYDVQILLENTAHGKKTIGNDLEDFMYIKEELYYPEKVGFCFDTAHAFSYGYNLAPQEDFIKVLDKTMGLTQIKLIHFNDTYDIQGSMQDRHADPGSGNIGKETLQNILNHESLRKIPTIIEAPEHSHTQHRLLLTEITSW